MLAMTSAAIDTSPLDVMLTERWDDPNAPGGAIIIAKGDSIFYERYAGLADLETRQPIGPQTQFNIASVSKQFTVMALLQQAAKYAGRMPLLDTPMSEFVDYGQPWWHSITPAMLASHTSGLPDTRTGPREWKVTATDIDAIKYFETLEKPAHGPGEYYDYLNPSFILLARIVEQLSNREFTEYVADNIFKPAGMASTYYFDTASRGENESHAYAPADDDTWQEYDYGEETFFATRPDGGIYSTARDMLSWLNALRDGIILDREWVALSRMPRVSVSDSPYCDYQRRPDRWYALGQYVEHHPGHPVKVFHTGDNGGYQAYLAVYPEEDIKIVVLENRHDKSRSQLADTIDKCLGL